MQNIVKAKLASFFGFWPSVNANFCALASFPACVLFQSCFKRKMETAYTLQLGSLYVSPLKGSPDSLARIQE